MRHRTLGGAIDDLISDGWVVEVWRSGRGAYSALLTPGPERDNSFKQTCWHGEGSTPLAAIKEAHKRAVEAQEED